MIAINNLTVQPINEEFLIKIAKKVLEEEKTKWGELSVVLVGQRRMRELNKRYRGKNRATDVLAFPESKLLLKEIQKAPLPREKQSLGEIVICLREVKKNAKRFNQSFQQELSRILIHGILHLLGEDHEKDEKAAQVMEAKEQNYLCRMQNMNFNNE